jgi:hypothetical protein
MKSNRSKNTGASARWRVGLTVALFVAFSAATCVFAYRQVRYHVDDLGTLKGGSFGCAMGLNNKGWTELMDTLLDQKSGNMLLRASLRIDGVKIDLGTLGGPNRFANRSDSGINDKGQVAVKFLLNSTAHFAVPDITGGEYA